MDHVNIVLENPKYADLADKWSVFLSQSQFIYKNEFKIIFDSEYPLICDDAGNKIRVNFNNTEYNKHKKGLKSEPLSRALGAGQLGLSVLDLTAGLGVDSVFLCQLGYKVTAIERNPVMYLALRNALDLWDKKNQFNLNFLFDDATNFLKSIQSDQFDVAYFDPMFPDKSKSALPKQEMVLFKKIVGHDEDKVQVIQSYVSRRITKRFVVKNPLKAEKILNPKGSIEGKVVRYDIY